MIQLFSPPFEPTTTNSPLSGASQQERIFIATVVRTCTSPLAVNGSGEIVPHAWLPAMITRPDGDCVPALYVQNVSAEFSKATLIVWADAEVFDDLETKKRLWTGVFDYEVIVARPATISTGGPWTLDENGVWTD